MPSVNFTYIKTSNISQLTQEMKNAKIYDLIQNMGAAGNVLNITTVRPLSPQELEVMYKVVSAHSPPSPTELMVQARVQAAMQFGQSLIIEFAAENVLMGFSTTDIVTMIAKYRSLMEMLQSGSLYTALEYMNSLTPDRYINANRKAKYVKKLKDFLGV